MRRSNTNIRILLFFSLIVIGLIIDFIKRLINDEEFRDSFMSVIVVVLVFGTYLVHLYGSYRKKVILSQFDRTMTISNLLNKYKNKPTDFEVYVADLYYVLGYQTQVTPKSNDGGKDVILKKGGRTFYAEVKLYRTSNLISREKIQKLHSAVIDGRVDGGIFVTTSDFTNKAVEYALRNKIELVNGERLADLISTARYKKI